MSDEMTAIGPDENAARKPIDIHTPLMNLWGKIHKKKISSAAYAPSREYCARLLEVYNDLYNKDPQENKLVANLPEWTKGFSQNAAGLEAVPRLQAAYADCTAYTPGKWLLEKELSQHRSKPDASPTWEKSSGIDVFDAADTAKLSGLAFSGGGIRSATFCLGVLQALAAKDKLNRFDYLSTVSGGGYIHQWLASWIYNEQPGQIDAVQKLLKPLPEKNSPARMPSQIQWLRRYSSYLTPQRGLLSADTWTMICTWFRNTFLNQIVLFGFLASCLLAVRGLMSPLVIAHLSISGNELDTAGIACAAFQVFGCCLLFHAIRAQRAAAKPSNPPKGAIGNMAVVFLIVLPGFLVAYVITLNVLQGTKNDFFLNALWPATLFILLACLTLAGLLPQQRKPLRRAKLGIGLLSLMTAIGFTMGAHWIAQIIPGEVLVLKATWWPDISSVCSHILCAVFGPVIFSALQFTAIRLQLGVLGNKLSESRREWMARFGAWAGIFGLLWLTLGSITWIGPLVCSRIYHAGFWHTLSAAGVVGALHAVTMYVGSSGKTDGKPKANGLFFGYSALDLLGLIGAPLCILTMLVILSSFVNRAIQACHSLQHILILVFIVVATFLFFGWRVDVNEFSMHGFYRNRLARCYLGATNPIRTADPFTGFDDHTETRSKTGMNISSLLPTKFQGGGKYDGPFPIFCSTINLTFGEDLAWQERKGASFAFTPLYSGYHVGWTAENRKEADTTFNGYVPTATFAYTKGGIPLSSATAACGAALNPNQGYSTQPALAFLMTIFNVRLGWWIANPRKPRIWPAENNQPSPRFGLRYLLGELFGVADDTSKFVCLCDGGKFENMGLYELVRRRCAFIVVCDAEQDTDFHFEGIGRAIAKCRTDFGAEIELKLDDLRPDPARKNLSLYHCVCGTIRYPAPPGAPPKSVYAGTIVYLKTSITGDETGDILHHRLTYNDFPNDSTLNQWFTESQFESYRRLGQITGEEAIGKGYI
jgi:hypothetical protein